MAARDELGDQWEVEALRDALKDARAASGLSQPQVARSLGTSQPTVARWESPDHRRIKVPSWEQLDSLLDLYRTSDTAIAQIHRLRREVDEARMPSVGQVLARSSQMQKRVLDLEKRATHIATFMPMIVPGSVQSESYMRAIFVGAGVAGQQLDDSVTYRLARRALFEDGGNRRWTLVMTEAALRWRLGGARVMAEQCAYLRDFRHARVDLGIIASETPVDFTVPNGFELYESVDGAEIIMGTLAGTAMIPDSDVKFSSLLETLERVTRLALFGEAASLVFGRYAAQYEQECAAP